MVILPFQPEILQVKNIDDGNNNDNNNHTTLRSGTESPQPLAPAAAVPVVSAKDDLRHGKSLIFNFLKSFSCVFFLLFFLMFWEISIMFFVYARISTLTTKNKCLHMLL